jgi:3-carboxy-cis,cis-muconate cycloisomerase
MSSELHDWLLEDREVSAWFGASVQLRTMLHVEAALAEAGAEAGLFAAEHAEAIRQAADETLYSHEQIAIGAASAGNIAIPLVRELTARVALRSPASAAEVHRGATSQDILDTALVLQLRGAVALIQDRLDRAAGACAALALRYAETPMLGRTWLQQATPITFGLKAAGWMDAIERARERIGAALGRALVLQLGGATGTLSTLGEYSGPVSAALARRLELALPVLSWHTHRDRLAELASALAIACGTLGKIARDLSLLAQGEVREAMEAPEPGRGGSSAMPQKQNPIAAAVALAAATRAPGLLSTMIAAMPQEHERGLGGWQAEWAALPELVKVTGGAASAIAEGLGSLVVDVERMRENLQATHGLPFAESVAAELSRHIGRSEAHAHVANAARTSSAERRPFLDVLAADPGVGQHIGRDELVALLSPDRHVRAARAMVQSVVAYWKRT